MSDQSYLEWPFFDDRHRKYAKELSEWVKKEIVPLQHEEPNNNSELDGLCRDFVKKLGEGGWLKYCVPKAFGGKLESFDVGSDYG